MSDTNDQRERQYDMAVYHADVDGKLTDAEDKSIGLACMAVADTEIQRNTDALLAAWTREVDRLRAELARKTSAYDELAATATATADRLRAERDSAEGDLRTARVDLRFCKSTIERVHAALDDSEWGGPERHDVVAEIRTALEGGGE